MNMEAQPDIQVFHPTMDEFKDMIGYIEKIESQGAHLAGLAKIVPPKEWKPIKDPDFFESEHFNNLDVESPIRQEFVGDQGTFLALNHLTKSMSVRDFRKITNDLRHAPPREFFDFDDLERKFWANINIGQPLYGADISGSLSDADLQLWNIANLPGVLNILKKETGIPGVTTPYLYYGMWKAGFAWHTEDLDLYSINYLHYGAPKHWYAVPPKYGWKLEHLARGLFHAEYSKCDQFLRHKTCYISPAILKQNNIPVRKIVQECGEIMITFPYGYHAGFNMGFNVAESTNFATKRWVRYGLAAKVCACKDDTVRIDMEPFVKKYLTASENEKFRNGETFLHPEDPNANVIMRRNASRKRKLSAQEDTKGAGTAVKVAKATGSGRRRLHFTVEHSEDEEEVKKPIEKKARPKKASKKHRGGRRGNATVPKFLKVVQRDWMWTYGDEERSDEDMEELFAKEKELNNRIGSSVPFCCVCALTTSPFERADVIDGRKSPEARPESSEPTLSELAFAKGTKIEDFNPNLYRLRGSRFVQCACCRIVVHTRCYGCEIFDQTEGNEKDDTEEAEEAEAGKVKSAADIEEMETERKAEVKNNEENDSEEWLCERCQDEEIRASCCLCPIRGGALKRTTCGRWAHLVCVLACDPINREKKAVRFGDLDSRSPIVVDPPASNRRKLSCVHCRTNRSGHLASCCYLTCTDFSGCHVTCAYLANVYMETGNHPFYFTLTCSRHRGVYENLSNNYHRSKMPAISVGTEVLAEDPDKHVWLRGVVTKCESIIDQYHLEFPDGQVSNDTPAEYVSCIDGMGGTMNVGDDVNVVWNDEATYVARFIGKTCHDEYEVHLISGKLHNYRRSEFFCAEETIPRRVKNKIIGSWPSSQ